MPQPDEGDSYGGDDFNYDYAQSYVPDYGYSGGVDYSDPVWNGSDGGEGYYDDNAVVVDDAPAADGIGVEESSGDDVAVGVDEQPPADDSSDPVWNGSDGGEAYYDDSAVAVDDAPAADDIGVEESSGGNDAVAVDEQPPADGSGGDSDDGGDGGNVFGVVDDVAVAAPSADAPVETSNAVTAVDEWYDDSDWGWDDSGGDVAIDDSGYVDDGGGSENPPADDYAVDDWSGVDDSGGGDSGGDDSTAVDDFWAEFYGVDDGGDDSSGAGDVVTLGAFNVNSDGTGDGESQGDDGTGMSDADAAFWASFYGVDDGDAGDADLTGSLIANLDGTYTDPETGEIVDEFGNPAAGVSDSTATAFGPPDNASYDPVWGVWVGPKGDLYDASGANVTDSFYDNFGQPTQKSNQTPQGGGGDRGGGSQGGGGSLSGGGSSSPSKPADPTSPTSPAKPVTTTPAAKTTPDPLTSLLTGLGKILGVGAGTGVITPGTKTTLFDGGTGGLTVNPGTKLPPGVTIGPDGVLHAAPGTKLPPGLTLGPGGIVTVTPGTKLPPGVVLTGPNGKTTTTSTPVSGTTAAVVGGLVLLAGVYFS